MRTHEDRLPGHPQIALRSPRILLFESSHSTVGNEGNKGIGTVGFELGAILSFSTDPIKVDSGLILVHQIL